MSQTTFRFSLVTQGTSHSPQNPQKIRALKNLLMPLFLMGCFPVDFQEVKRPLRTKSVKRPIKVGKRPINEGKRPIKAKVLVGVSVGCLMGCFRAPPPWRKTAPLKRPIKRSMRAHSSQKLLRNYVCNAQIVRVAQEPNRNREPEPSEPFFPETESGTGTAGTVFQEPKPEPEPSFPAINCTETQKKTFLQRNRRN